MKVESFANIETEVSIIEAIRLVENISDSSGAPVRQIVSYWTKEGELIGRTDKMAGQSNGGYVEIGEDGEVQCRY